MLLHAPLVAIGLLLPRQDTTPVIAAAPDTAPPSYAPSMDNRSLLGATTAALPVIPIVSPPPEEPGMMVPDTTRRHKAITYSDGYYTRLKIHKLASYLTLPLFVGQYFSGRALWNNPHSHGLARDVHGPLAAGIAGLFAVNTVTGVWNLWEDRKNPEGRTRRWVHGLTMLVADAGFVVVGATTPEREDRFGGTPTPFSQQSGAKLHRDLAIGSMGLALGSYVMMLIWKD